MAGSRLSGADSRLQQEWPGGARRWLQPILKLALLAHAAAWSVPARAEDTDIIIVGWLDHFTYGLVNTAIGLPVALGGMVVNAIRGEKPRVEMNKTWQQIKFPTASWNHYTYATGAIQHGGCCDAHEAGHGKQSGALGAAFLPLVGITYLLQGMDQGVIETWADAWQDLGSTMKNTHPLRVEMELRDADGNLSQRIGVNFIALERASRVDAAFRGASNPTTVAYRYGRVAVHIILPTAGESYDASTILGRIDAALLEKDFSAEWTIASGVFSVLLDSQQRTGGMEWELEDDSFRVQALSQRLGMGVRIGDEKSIAFDLMGFASGSIEGLWFVGAGSSYRDPGLQLMGGVGGEARLHILDAVQLYVSKMRYWGTSGYIRDVEQAGAETPAIFRAAAFTDRGRKGKPTDLMAGFKLLREHESLYSLSGQAVEREVRTLLFTFGGRF